MKLATLLVLAALAVLEKCEGCGWSSGLKEYTRHHGRIVGGTEVDDCDDIPWQVQLNLGGYLCGGSILDQEHILTAAHCTDGMQPSDIDVFIGGHIRTDYERETHSVQTIFQHELYRPSSHKWDISILRLRNPIKAFSRCIRKVCLDDDSKPHPLGDCIVSGWGTTSSGGQVSKVLKMATVTTTRGDKCNTESYGYVKNETQMICAEAPNTDSCQGDSGGPLVCRNARGQYVQVGIVSYGYGCAEPGYPGVYASVHAFRHWIAATKSK